MSSAQDTPPTSPPGYSAPQFWPAGRVHPDRPFKRFTSRGEWRNGSNYGWIAGEDCWVAFPLEQDADPECCEVGCEENMLTEKEAETLRRHQAYFIHKVQQSINKNGLVPLVLDGEPRQQFQQLLNQIEAVFKEWALYTTRKQP